MDSNHPLQSILGFISSQPGHNKHDGANLSEQWRGITELPPYQDCDRSVLLNNLIFLEQKVLDLQGVVKSMIHENPDLSDSEGVSVAILQQMVVAEIASIITQMISTAGRLLNLGQEKSKGKSCSELNPVIAQLGTLLGASGRLGAQNLQQLANGFFGFVTKNCGGEGDCCNRVVEKPVCSVQEFEHGSAADLDISITEVRKDETEDGEEENLLSSGCYEVLELEKEEILAPHTHFCLICGKGFKRDANLRMHMRGHGDMFKTPESLANPNKGAKLDLVQSRRYSCPFEGCKRNRKHKKFQPLKTILCVKNHYKRSHCDKSYICSRCNRKKFSIIADLKTHEKHCGEDKWMCSCGTSFSRKDKLFGHVSLFHGGHTPVLPTKEFDRCKIPDEETKCESQRTSVIAQGAFGTGSVPSAKLSCGASYDQQVLADTNLQNEENKFHSAQPGTPQSPSTLMISPFSLQSLLSYSFIEPDGENSI